MANLASAMNSSKGDTPKKKMNKKMAGAMGEKMKGKGIDTGPSKNFMKKFGK